MKRKEKSWDFEKNIPFFPPPFKIINPSLSYRFAFRIFITLQRTYHRARLKFGFLARLYFNRI